MNWAPRKVDRGEARIGTAVARWGRLRPGGAARLAGAPVELSVLRVGAITLDPDGAVAVVRGGPEPVLVVGAGALARAIAQVILGGPDELAAPRAPTVAEQAVWALVVSTGLADVWSGALSVEPSRIAPAMIGMPGQIVEVAVVAAGVRGLAWIAVPAAVLDRPGPVAPLAALARDRGGWLDAWIEPAPVVIANAAITLGELGGIKPRDVIVVGAIGAPGEGSLRVGRGELPVTLAADADRVTVRARYQRGRMDETLGDDLTVELAVSAGTARLSARKLLELAPGEVVALGRPATGQVELVLGQRVIGRGELIDVDGELAVRVLALDPR